MTGLAVIRVEAGQGGAAPGGDTPIPVPSGQTVTLIEVIWNEAGPEGLTFRFRFLAPGIGPGGGIGFEVAAADMLALCETYVRPRLAGLGTQAAQVIVSLSDTILPFGQAAPEATQFFEAFRVEGDTCIWEPF